MPRRFYSWADVLAALDLEQSEIVQAATADPVRRLGEIARSKCRQPHEIDRLLGEAFTYLGKVFTDQARAATDGRDR
jgi:hypothetical protein